MRFRVTWEVDIEAKTPEQAAQMALAIQRDPESTATIFDVVLCSPCPSCKCHHLHKKQCKAAVLMSICNPWLKTVNVAGLPTILFQPEVVHKPKKVGKKNA